MTWFERIRMTLVAGVVVVLVAAGWTLSPLPVGTVAVEAVEVIGDDELDQYAGSGAVILPSSIAASSRHQAANCVGCRWKVTMPCQREDDHQDAACRGIILGCPQGREVKRAWVAGPGRDFEPVGLFCPSDGEATSVADATREVRSGFTHRLAPLRPACDPPRGAVVGIALHCRSGQPAAQVGWQDTVAGFPVTTQARARWRWAFSSTDGREAVQVSDQPGSRYPEPGVRHTFQSVGGNQVAVRAVWSAQFWIDGLGPFPVHPDLTQDAQISVPTGSALGVIRP